MKKAIYGIVVAVLGAVLGAGTLYLFGLVKPSPTTPAAAPPATAGAGTPAAKSGGATPAAGAGAGAAAAKGAA